MKMSFAKKYKITLFQLFEERPVWSKFALLAVTKFNADQLKYLLPAVAYYFVTGPFRILWVRFGYDPRKDPSSKIYQSIDFRIRVAGKKVTSNINCYLSMCVCVWVHVCEHVNSHPCWILTIVLFLCKINHIVL